MLSPRLEVDIGFGTVIDGRSRPVLSLRRARNLIHGVRCHGIILLAEALWCPDRYILCLSTPKETTRLISDVDRLMTQLLLCGVVNKYCSFQSFSPRSEVAACGLFRVQNTNTRLYSMNDTPGASHA